MRITSEGFKDFLTAFEAMPEKEKKEALAFAEQECAAFTFIPNPGPQTEAYYSPADELFFGGAGGGGKTALLCGLPVNEHHDIQIFRRESTQLRGIVKELTSILGSTEGFNSQLGVWRLPDGQTIELAGVKDENDKEKWQGREADFKGFDEICHFTRSQYRFIIGWNRSTRPNQRCRVVATGNPPMTAEGLWVIEHWAPWLDETHPDPALPGELRYPVALSDDEPDKEIFFRDRDEAIQHLEKLRSAPRDYDGNLIPPRSRSFIPAYLEDNPDLMKSGYAAVIEAMPDEVKAALKGSFKGVLQDDQWQVIPTQWIIDAQKRWTPNPPEGVPMTAMGVDVAQGGADNSILARRHATWFDHLIKRPGIETPKPSDVAGMVVTERRDRCAVIVDVGGGYGGGVIERLEDNQIPCVAFNGSGEGVGRTADRQFGFYNKRAEAIWRLREDLDPDRPGGSHIALPPSPSLRSDLTAYRWSLRRDEILIESKEEIIKRIGRSPDEGDAVMMCWSEGNSALVRQRSGPQARDRRLPRSSDANVGYQSAKAKRRQR